MKNRLAESAGSRRAVVRRATLDRSVTLIDRLIRAGHVLVLIALALSLAAPSLAQTNIKMATLAPEGSPYDKILRDMGEAWKTGTDGRVELTVYAGGVVGDEPDILRKLKIGQYQAAALSVSGLVDIHKDFTVFEVPLFYRDFDEMAHVLEELTPSLSKRLEDGGFKLLGWGYVGWVYFFTTERAQSVADMKKMKIFTWAGDAGMERWWRENGFQPVALSANDIVTGLQTGMITALSVPPLYASQVQFYKQAKYMADMPLAPMIGAILMSKRSFDKLSAADQAALLAAGKVAQEQVFVRIPAADTLSVKLMESQGLEVVPIEGTPAAAEWKAKAEEFAEDMRGDMVPEPIFDEAMKARTAWRAQQEAAGAADGGGH